VNNFADKLTRLLSAALFVDSIYRPGEWKHEADLTPEERERGEAWRRFNRPDAKEKSRK
jgi:hypothetical protein